uniref:Uncharacterized protein n=1 Tax=Anopheles atroparvus TaxID=41427 RepID=A0A182IT49_ANOAO
MIHRSIAYCDGKNGATTESSPPLPCGPSLARIGNGAPQFDDEIIRESERLQIGRVDRFGKSSLTLANPVMKPVGLPWASWQLNTSCGLVTVDSPTPAPPPFMLMLSWWRQREHRTPSRHQFVNV